jgi:phosphocarrier protein
VTKKTGVTRQAMVINELGMHARPAARIAETAMEGKGDIFLSKGSSEVDAASIIDILTLGAEKGSQILITAESEEDTGIVEKIKAFFDSGFGELNNE